MSLKRALPPLLRLTELEARAIESMFRLYDYKATGRIPQHLAHKLFSAMGFDFSIHMLPQNGTLKELLLFLDMRCPDPEPALHCALHSFIHLVQSKRGDSDPEELLTEEKIITAKDINKFMESLGRPPVSVTECNLLLTSMMEYDDCSLVPAVLPETFNRDFATFAKKSNMLKNFK